jgi:perosamine synthetase
MSSELPFIPLSAPDLRGNEWAYAKDCLDTGWVSSVGSYVSRFENQVSKISGQRFAVATTCGTAALHISLILAGVSHNDEVIAPSLTFIAPINAITYVGAIPVLFDAEPFTWQIDVSKVKLFLEKDCICRPEGVINKVTNRRVAAILPVHVLGHPVEMDSLVSLAQRFNLPVIEDASEALGSSYKGREVGSAGMFACYSFNGNKIITTGGGGMLVTSNADSAEKARYLTTQAKDDTTEYIHNTIGFNYRLTNVLAAIGCAQTEKLNHFVNRRREINGIYQAHLADVPGVRVLGEADEARSNFWLSAIQINSNLYGMSSRQLRERLKETRIESRTMWQPIHLSPAHQNAVSLPCPVAEKVFETALCLPSSSFLTDEEVLRVISVIRDSR